MPAYARKRGRSVGSRGTVFYNSRNKRKVRLNPNPSRYTPYGARRMAQTALQLVNNMRKTIETKTSDPAFEGNIQLPHNNVYVHGVNPLATNQGVGDPMNSLGNRIGDKITVSGLSCKIFLEGALGRSKVYFRIMLLRGARGASFSRADIYKNGAANKMLDDINTEKYTIIAQKIVTVQPPNTGPYSIVPLTGVPQSQTASGITGNRILKFWIPGKRFGKGGVITYETDGGQAVKFYDYKWVSVAYDWYGTPQDTNNVGVINEMYNRLYYKDA